MKKKKKATKLVDVIFSINTVVMSAEDAKIPLVKAKMLRDDEPTSSLL